MTLLILSCAWLIGVGLGALLPGGALPLPFVLVLVGAGGVALTLGWPSQRARWAAGCSLALVLGLARVGVALPPDAPPPGSLRSYNVPAAAARAAPTVTVRGIVRDEPYLNSAHTSLLVRVDVT